ncbi:HNH endonuclease [Comamonas kerstersii]|uniref:HNH endonuclease n=1 Tax=Comamonas kerstersii TaxID=225992 RepID=UPI001B32E9DD|nr:HNH endonuclease [Comamonas kerstersii]QTW18704.1 HNH endonuclease [Comamonas kerstersii]
MIKLNKGPEPDILTRNKEQWTRELLDACASKDEERIKTLTKRYNHQDIKSALKEETRQKCAYCEANVTDVAHGDIEHVTPKSINREKTFEWTNLTFSCQICNQNKSNKEGILDPYSDEPSDHIFFAGAFAKGKSLVGTRAVLELKLNRIALIESRNREIERYANQLEKIFLIQDERVKDLLLVSMLEELDSGRPEFVATCRILVEQYRPQQIENIN